MSTLLAQLSLDSEQALYSDIGFGNRPASLVAEQFRSIANQGDNPLLETDMNANETLKIKGTEGMLVDFSKCCHPIPGDPVVGVLNAGKGLLVHRARCLNVRKLLRHPDQCVPLSWDEEVKSEFIAKIQLEVINQRGILAMIALSVSDAEGNVEDISVEDRDGQNYLVVFTLWVRGRQHLAEIMRSLRRISAVVKMTRMLKE